MVTLAGMLLTWAAPGAAFLLVFPLGDPRGDLVHLPQEGRSRRAGQQRRALRAGHRRLPLDAPSPRAPRRLWRRAPGRCSWARSCSAERCSSRRSVGPSGGASPWITAVLLAVGLGAGALATRARALTPDQPGKLNLVHVQTAGGEGPLLVGPWLRGGGLGFRGAYGACQLPRRCRPEASLRADPLGGQDGLQPEHAPGQRPPSPSSRWSTVGSPRRGARPGSRMRTNRGGDELLLNAAGARRHAGRGGHCVAARGCPGSPRANGWLEFEVDLADELEASITVFDKRFGLSRVLTQRAEMFPDGEREPLLVPAPRRRRAPSSRPNTCCGSTPRAGRPACGSRARTPQDPRAGGGRVIRRLWRLRSSPWGPCWSRPCGGDSPRPSVVMVGRRHPSCRQAQLHGGGPRG